MKSNEKNKFYKELILVSSLFMLCGFALYQFSEINKEIPKEKPKITTTVNAAEISAGIHEPLDKKIAFAELEFDVLNGIEFHQPTGTHVVIPKSSIVDAKGKLISGKVKVKFREIHDAKSIFLSGIPMQTEANRGLFLESNGMVEIRVFQGETELSLQEGKQVQVDLATKSRPSSDFKLWVLDKNKKWLNAGTFQTVTNSRRDQQLLQLDDEKKKRKNKGSSKKSDFQFEFNSNLENFPHMAAWKGVKWNLIQEDVNFPTMDIARVDWTDITMKKIDNNSNEYMIKLTFSKEDYSGNLVQKTCSIIAVPADLSRKELQAKNDEFANLSKQYEEFLILARKEEERLRAESALLNQFRANGFGIYNVDKLTNAEQLVKLDVHFDFENEMLLSKNPIQLVVVSPDRNTVLNFLPANWNNIPYLGPKTEIFASLPGGKYAYVDAKMFDEIVHEEKLSKTYQNKITFKTRRLTKEEVNNYF
jgi:hypothetical protein